ncbi:MAG: FRG domain-containing protein [Methanophagales archaeon]|nr:FRG domain-containing protein [Methanophagales archaeon]
MAKIYRNNPSEIDIFVARLRQIEFELVLREHPAIPDIQKDGIHISFSGLAQHYELATDYLDVTSDPYIAAFFAVCTYCQSEQRYIPVSSQNGPGVLMKTVYPATEPKLEIVGLQPFPRPGNQKAYAVKLPKGENFSAHKVLFHHSKENSQKIYDLFDGGKKLFPPDPIKNKAQEISEGVAFSQEAFEQVLQRYDFARRAEYYLNGLRENKIKTSNTWEYHFSITEINQFKDGWENGKKSEFYNQIGPTRLTYF